MALFLVTQGEYATVTGVNPSNFTSKQMDASSFLPPPEQPQLDEKRVDLRKVAGKDTGRYPVEMVNWEEAQEFCRKLSALPAERAARRSYRLPTEAEWEYTCRAGTLTRWSCGDNAAVLKDNAWFRDNAGGATHPVGQKRPNAWNLCDMHGNVNQWCADWFAADYGVRVAGRRPDRPRQRLQPHPGAAAAGAALRRCATRPIGAPGARPAQPLQRLSGGAGDPAGGCGRQVAAGCAGAGPVLSWVPWAACPPLFCVRTSPKARADRACHAARRRPSPLPSPGGEGDLLCRRDP